MRASASKHGWVFLDAHVRDIIPHGICAGFARKDRYLDSSGRSQYIPLYPHVRNGEWYPMNPSLERAYDVSRARWFRNTNDSVLFQNDNTDSVMNGAFHPDFRVHALMADHIYIAVISKWNEALIADKLDARR